VSHQGKRSVLAVASIAVAGLLGGCAAPESIGSAPAGPVESTVAKPPSTAAKPSKPAPKGTTSAPVKVVRRLVVESRRIPFKKVSAEDPDLPAGERVVRVRGARGTKRLTFEVTLTNGVQTGKRLLRETVVREPVDQVTAVGTKVESEPDGQCDPNYSGGCVPVASDVDCAGGSGNGPAYVRGPVTVTGDDVYGLDRDKDGLGCED
jgi:hypothetical protein